MKNNFKKHLRQFSISERDDLFNHPDFTYLEKWILRYTYFENRYIANTCMKLNISKGTYYINKLTLDIKLYYILKK